MTSTRWPAAGGPAGPERDDRDASGWPKSTVAPVYALASSFMLVLVLGAVLNLVGALKNEQGPGSASPSGGVPTAPTPTSAGPAPPPLIIRVEPVEAASVVKNVSIWQENTRIGDGTPVEDHWNYTPPPDAKPIIVCLQLAKGWIVTNNPIHFGDSGDSKSGLFCKDRVKGQIEFFLERQ
jgi:hypothetical protein